MPSLRTKSREFAMQMLFQWDMSQQDPAKLEAKFWRAAKAADTTRAFANRLFEGAAKEVTILDEIIVKHAENWRFERLAAIDRAGLKGGNKGFEAGLAAIEMAQLSRKLVAGKSPSAATKTFPPQKARRK